MGRHRQRAHVELTKPKKSAGQERREAVLGPKAHLYERGTQRRRLRLGFQPPRDRPLPVRRQRWQDFPLGPRPGRLERRSRRPIRWAHRLGGGCAVEEVGRGFRVHLRLLQLRPQLARLGHPREEPHEVRRARARRAQRRRERSQLEPIRRRVIGDRLGRRRLQDLGHKTHYRWPHGQLPLAPETHHLRRLAPLGRNGASRRLRRQQHLLVGHGCGGRPGGGHRGGSRGGALPRPAPLSAHGSAGPERTQVAPAAAQRVHLHGRKRVQHLQDVQHMRARRCCPRFRRGGRSGPWGARRSLASISELF
mmetsp:Transcript_133534/g.386525  ORF Transcript_133534/g.386525 Transcript_133534/m.386525 type:complete len:307 (+) Transcript_133534:707-1627(+)